MVLKSLVYIKAKVSHLIKHFRRHGTDVKDSSVSSTSGGSTSKTSLVETGTVCHGTPISWAIKGKQDCHRGNIGQDRKKLMMMMVGYLYS